jgi:protein phosphatase
MSPASLMRWNSAAVTHTGCIRSSNQDAYLDRPDLGLWAVADGMGGHAAGETASRLIVEGLARLSHPQCLESLADEAARILSEVNQQLIEEAERRFGDIIGSTVVALMAVADRCALLWAGDSRAYRLRHGSLEQLTLDHSLVQGMVDEGLLSPEMAEVHPLANVLLRALGGDANLALDRRVEPLQPGDRYLLCSDGVPRELTRERMAEIMERADPAETARELVEAALAAGGRDNLTAVVVHFAAD